MRKRGVQRVSIAYAIVFLASLACSPGGNGAEPSITITNPASGSTVGVGQEIEIISMAVADEGVDRVDLFVDGERVRYDEPPSGNPTTFSIAQSWTPGEAGEVAIAVVVIDTAGEESEEAVITLDVQEGGVAEVPPAGATETPVPPVDGGGCTLNASFVADVTVPDDTEFALRLGPWVQPGVCGRRSDGRWSHHTRARCGGWKHRRFGRYIDCSTSVGDLSR